MKRIISLFLIMLLLLSGCGASTEEAPLPSDAPTNVVVPEETPEETLEETDYTTTCMTFNVLETPIDKISNGIL